MLLWTLLTQYATSCYYCIALYASALHAVIIFSPPVCLSICLSVCLFVSLCVYLSDS